MAKVKYRVAEGRQVNLDDFEGRVYEEREPRLVAGGDTFSVDEGTDAATVAASWERLGFVERV